MATRRRTRKEELEAYVPQGPFVQAERAYLERRRSTIVRPGIPSPIPRLGTSGSFVRFSSGRPPMTSTSFFPGTRTRQALSMTSLQCVRMEGQRFQH